MLSIRAPYKKKVGFIDQLINGLVESLIQSRQLLLKTIAGVVFIASILIAITWHNLNESYDYHVQRGVDAAANQARVLSYELNTEMRLIDNALATIAHEFQETGSSTREFENAVVNQRALLPFSKAVRVADEAGMVRLGLLPGEHPFSINEREYFGTLKRSDQMVISEPLISHSFKEWSVVLSRKLEAPDGTFKGAVFVVLEVEHFRKLFEKLTPGEDSATTLRSAEGRLVARYSAADPTSTAGIGGTLTSLALKEARRLNPEHGWYVTPTALDGIERITAYQSLSTPYSLTVYTGIGTESYLQPWRNEAVAVWSLTAFCVLLMAFGAGSLFVHQQRELTAKLQNAQLLKEQNFFVENDLIGMIKVRDRKILWANKAMARMLGKRVSELLLQSKRCIYPDNETYERMGRLSSEALGHNRRFRTEVQLQHCSGHAFWVDANAAEITDTDSVWIFVDVEAHKKRQQEIEYQATHDALTGLANRRFINKQMQQFIALADRDQGTVAVCFIDLDGFKSVNDTYGHDAGDIVLKTVAERLTSAVRTHDCVARLGGDEFVVVLTGQNNHENAVQTMQRCLDMVRIPIAVEDGHTAIVGCSIGIAYYEGEKESCDSLLERADEAMYLAKNAGKGRIIESACEQASESTFDHQAVTA
ncbi:diguanylate cyclase [Comamonas thiooxydans]|uniref:sensor domain-containing diguanylate cyclase n=1 Tax=Comamonas thiooxydans TaxID=363952 RepID=UPI00244CBF1B|nr:diguanylate cyclase [Comamonas thiooxydans]MDH1477293.1 diguanylate cyclase [Comamonas thiooxydans]